MASMESLVNFYNLLQEEMQENGELKILDIKPKNL